MTGSQVRVALRYVIMIIIVVIIALVVMVMVVAVVASPVVAGIGTTSAIESVRRIDGMITHHASYIVCIHTDDNA